MLSRRRELLISSSANTGILLKLLPDRSRTLIGLPLNMDGTEGPRAKLVRDFAARLEERVSHSIHFEDERLTSADADWSMAQTGMTRGQKKNRRDAIAAAGILRTFLSRVG